MGTSTTIRERRLVYDASSPVRTSLPFSSDLDEDNLDRVAKMIKSHLRYQENQLGKPPELVFEFNLSDVLASMIEYNTVPGYTETVLSADTRFDIDAMKVELLAMLETINGLKYTDDEGVDELKEKEPSKVTPSSTQVWDSNNSYFITVA